MAVGAGLLFNLRLPINFAAPFRATSVIDLWRRWHVSLSRFLRDFVYLPLGGNRGGPIRGSFSLIVTMVIGGFWHGANWTFLAWGAFHGVLLAINHAWRSRRGARKPTRLGRFAGWFATFVAFAIGMAFFRAADIAAAGHLLEAMAGLGGSPADAEIKVPWDLWGLRSGYLSESFVRSWLGSYWSLVGTLWVAGAVAVALFVPDTMELVDYREGEPHCDWRRPKGMLAWQPSVAWAAVVIALFAFSYIYFWQFSEFLYYQF